MGYFPTNYWPTNYWPPLYPYWPQYGELVVHPTSYDIAKQLENNAGLSLTYAVNLFIGREPASPDNCVTIFDTPGRPPEQFYNMDQRYLYPAIQIRVRNKHHLVGWTMINAIKEFLHNKANFTQGGTRYLAVECLIEPALLDFDENRRVRFVSTFDLQVVE